MSDAVQIIDHNNGRYVRESDYLDLQQEYNNLKNLLSGFVGQLAEKGIQQRPPTPAQQASEIEAAEAKHISDGDQLYLVSADWWCKWCSYMNYKQPGSIIAETNPDSSIAPGVPGSIDNTDILSGSKLREKLKEYIDFVIVTSDSWQLLHSWYGGGPSITRTAVMKGLGRNSKHALMVLYPMRLEVCWGGNVDEVKTIEVDKHGTLGSLKERACAAFGVEPDSVEIWDYFNHGKYANLEKDLEVDLEAARILEDQPILLDDKKHPLPCMGLA